MKAMLLTDLRILCKDFLIDDSRVGVERALSSDLLPSIKNKSQ